MKTNHQRGFKERRKHEPKYMEGFKVSETCVSGEVVRAYSSVGDAVAGKHGIARDRRGAKKFVHSRRRCRDRDTLLAMTHTEVED